MANMFVERSRERQRIIAANRAQRNAQRQENMAARRDIANNAYLTRMQSRNATNAGADPQYVAQARQQAMLYGDTIGGYQDRRQGYMDRGAQRDLLGAQSESMLIEARSPEAVANIKARSDQYLGDQRMTMMREGMAFEAQNAPPISVRPGEALYDQRSGRTVYERDPLPAEPSRPVVLKPGDAAVDPDTGRTIYERAALPDKPGAYSQQVDELEDLYLRRGDVQKKIKKMRDQGMSDEEINAAIDADFAKYITDSQ